MATSKLVKWGAAGFVLSGVVLIVLTSAAVFTGLLADLVLSAGIVYFYIYLVLTGIVSQLLLGLGVVGLHALQKGRYGSLGLTGFYTILVALAVRILAEVVALANPQAIPWLRSPVGLLVLIVGFVLYGLASLQARMLPRWYSVLLIIFVPVSYVLGRLGLLPDIWFGAALLVLGFVLWQQGEALAEQPAPVA